MSRWSCSYFRSGPDRWVRFLSIQIGFHGEGRRRLFSERYGYRKGMPTLRVGRCAEVSIGRVRDLSRSTASLSDPERG